MKSFEYAAPRKLEDALALLGDTWGETEIMAGGTDLVTCLKQHITEPRRVVSLKNISELKGIHVDRKMMRIGATTTLAEAAEHAALQKNFPAIATAIQNISSPQMLHAGTMGGDICQRPRCWYFRNGHGLLGMDEDTSLVKEGDNRYHAIFGNTGPALFVSASSLGPALVALGATIHVVGRKKAKREIPASEFFRTPANERERETALKPQEIVSEIHVPLQGLKNAIYEVRHRKGLDWPYVSAAVAFQWKGNSASDCRVVLGHVAPIPWRSEAGAKAMEGSALDESVAAKAGEAAVSGAKPLSRNAYKVQLVKTAVKRSILTAVGLI